MRKLEAGPAAKKLYESLTSEPCPAVRALLRSYGYTDEQIDEKVADASVKEQKRLAEVAAKYGFSEEVDKRTLSILSELEEHLSYCAYCDGKECKKNCQSYTVPTLEKYRDELYLRWGPCVVERRRRADMNLPVEFRGMTFEDLDLTGRLHDSAKDVQHAAVALEWAKKAVADGTTNLYFYGTFGSGKTLMASLMAKEFLVKGKSVEFGTVARLLGELKETFDDPTRKTEDVIKRFRYCDVLILDDVGAENQTAWKLEQLFELVNARYESHKQLVITSNYSPEELRDVLGRVNSVKAGQLMSRIMSICEAVYTGETDIRLKRAKLRRQVDGWAMVAKT